MLSVLACWQETVEAQCDDSPSRNPVTAVSCDISCAERRDNSVSVMGLSLEIFNGTKTKPSHGEINLQAIVCYIGVFSLPLYSPCPFQHLSVTRWSSCQTGLWPSVEKWTPTPGSEGSHLGPGRQSAKRSVF